MPPVGIPVNSGGDLARWMSARLGEQVEVPEMHPHRPQAGRRPGDGRHAAPASRADR